MNDQNMYILRSPPIPARQGSGMCQFSPNEIMVMGGFNGKFMTDYYVMKVEQNTGNLHDIQMLNRNNANHNLFPF